MKLLQILMVGLVVSFAGAADGLAKDDRHAGYYYPEPQSREVYKARTDTWTDSDRNRRLGFITGVVAGNAKLPYPPMYVMFAKGSDAEKLIIVSLQEGQLNTLYRMRAALAALTASTRTTPVFQKLDPQSRYTFFDLLKLLGFKQLTVSDGDSFAHQVMIE